MPIDEALDNIPEGEPIAESKHDQQSMDSISKIKRYLVKEHTETHCIIRTTLYDRSLDYLVHLLKIAQKDFPSIEPKDIQVVQYGGKRYAKTRGLEFEIPKGFEVPDDYTSINELEYYM
jgi:hypothetical protein